MQLCWPLAALMLLAPSAAAAQAQPVPLPRAKPGAPTTEESPAPPVANDAAPTAEKVPAPAVEKSPEPPVEESPTPPDAAGPARLSACLRELAESGVVAVRAADIVSKGQCFVDEPMVVEAVETHKGRISLPARPTLECRFAASLGAWLKEVVSPVAAALLDSPAEALVTGPGYQCRDRQGGKVSEHGLGNAIDIAEVRLADGRRIPASRLLNAEGTEGEFLRAVSTSACGYFTTVLGPGSDSAHADHLHVDMAERKSTEYRICIAR
jgi:hypothetical protein